MKYVGAHELLENVADVLRTVVLPHCTERYAAGQIWAAIGIVENVAARVEERTTIHATEANLWRSWLAANDAPTRPEDDLVTLRRRCQRVIAERSVWNTEDMESLLSILEQIQDAERPYRRPTYFHEALGG